MMLNLPFAFFMPHVCAIAVSQLLCPIMKRVMAFLFGPTFKWL
jgi:hypothetical protein